MTSPPGRRLLVTRDPNVLQRVRTGLTGAGAPPAAPSGTALDSTSALARSSRSALGRAVERLRAGPASAVDEVQPLYDAGLPRGLPGNLHAIAMSDERAELLARRARVAAASAEKEAALKASGAAAAQRATRKLGAYDRHAPAQAAAAPPCRRRSSSSRPLRARARGRARAGAPHGERGGGGVPAGSREGAGGSRAADALAAPHGGEPRAAAPRAAGRHQQRR